MEDNQILEDLSDWRDFMLCNRPENMERFLSSAKAERDGLRAENERMRSTLERIVRIAKRVKESCITKNDAIEHCMRLARYADGALNPPNETVF